MKSFNAALDDLLRRRKTEIGLTHEQVGEAAHINHSYVSRLRHGEKPTPPHTTIEQLASALGVEPEYFKAYRDMKRVAISLAAPGREPTAVQWAAARMAVLATQDQDAPGE